MPLIQALRIDVFLQRSQGCLVADDSGPDTENVSSSNCREFDGGIIAHAAEPQMRKATHMRSLIHSGR